MDTGGRRKSRGRRGAGMFQAEGTKARRLGSKTLPRTWKQLAAAERNSPVLTVAQSQRKDSVYLRIYMYL